ncbi:restriction endonuclease [Actinoplanes sp. NPDC049596]|uniref:restriction endonuclease n=1 Tax=unclassified Actinoplanes TaxID=2626549 RepID=UPI003422CB5B
MARLGYALRFLPFAPASGRAALLVSGVIAVVGADPSATHVPLTSVKCEQAVADIAKSVGREITGWRVQHLDPVDGLDGTYIIDVTARFLLAGMDFLVLFECKRHKSSVKREHVQTLHTKLQSTGARRAWS